MLESLSRDGCGDLIGGFHNSLGVFHIELSRGQPQMY